MKRSSVRCARRMCALVWGLSIAAVPAQAFQIAVGVGDVDACHEQITLEAYDRTAALFPLDRINVSSARTWEQITDYLLDEVGRDIEDRRAKYLVWSLFVGVRSVDNDGHSSSNINSLRNIHLDPDRQYDHCLRAPEDDNDEGNVPAVAGCIERITEQLALGAELAMAPPEGQSLEVNFTLSFYGTIRVNVWGPGYHLGRALHPLQDSFAHTVRSADLREIYHVMNYAEAVGGSHRDRRDGLPHSDFSDRCQKEKNREPTLAATQASEELLALAARYLETGEDDGGLEQLLDDWMRYRSGCDFDNDFCNSPWVERARKDPSRSFGCGVAAGPGTTGTNPGIALVGPVLAAMILGRRRNTAGSPARSRSSDRPTRSMAGKSSYTARRRT